MKNFLFAIMLVVTATTSVLAQTPERHVFLVHGLVKNGSGLGAWSHYNAYFNNTRKLDPIPFQYSQQGTIDQSSIELRGKMQAATPSSSYPTNFVICHSMGAAVVRNLCKNTPNLSQLPFGGFITVGGVNHGSQVINSYLTGKFTTFSQNAVADLLAGPTPSYLDDHAKFIPDWANSKLAEYLEKKIIEQSAIDNPAAAQLAFGGPFMTGLANHTASIPKVGIVSQEDKPNSHWKTITSYALRPVTQLGFNEVDDDDLEIYMKAAKDFYQAKVDKFNKKAAQSWRIRSPRYFREKAERWLRGVNWFNKSEHAYLELIGGSQLVPVYTTVTQPSCPPPCTSMDCAYGNMGCSFQNGSYTYISSYVEVNVDTDGIVTKSNQYLPGALVNVELPSGVNHAQQRNHPFITNAFNDILNGSINGISTTYFKSDLL
jgi:hypothetical protein